MSLTGGSGSRLTDRHTSCECVSEDGWNDGEIDTLGRENWRWKKIESSNSINFTLNILVQKYLSQEADGCILQKG